MRAGPGGAAPPSARIPPQVRWFEQQTLRRRVKRSLAVPTDPWFSKQWYMVSRLGRLRGGPGHAGAR